MNPRLSIPAIAALILVGFLFGFAGRASAVEETLHIGAKKKMLARLILPDGAGPFPAILVLHTSSGLRPADIEYATRLAREGYVCLVPAFMEAYGITHQNRQATFTTHGDETFADLVDGVELLRCKSGRRRHGR